MTLHIVADENIAALDEYFSPHAHIVRKNGRALQAEDLAAADALLVRSVSEVNASLLATSNVQFVGSATIGTDHIDTEFLAEAGIAFASAPGSNAASVADYVCSALAVLVPKLESLQASGLRAGVIGLGEVGSRVAQRLQVLGYQVRAYDPLINALKAGNTGIEFAGLNDVLQCDVVSIHVPLSTSGRHATRRMIDTEQLRRLPQQAIIINTSRGDVMCGKALSSALEKSQGLRAVLDVWQGEPDIDAALAAQVSIATPHIAGYAYEGKLRGTAMLAEAFAAHFHLNQSPITSGYKQRLLELQGAESLNDILLQAFDIRRDEAALRQVLSSQELAVEFDGLRKNYPQRREYSATLLQARRALPVDLTTYLSGLGFPLSLNSSAAC